jgi:hypothetical protein
MSKHSLFAVYKIGRNSRRGVLSLATMLVLGAVVVQIGLVGFILSYYLNISNSGIKYSSYATAGAEAGIADGILRIIRDDYLNNVSFSLESETSNVYVVICRGGTADCDPDVALLPPEKVQILAVAGSIAKKRILRAIVNVDPLTHAVTVERIEEIDQL